MFYGTATHPGPLILADIAQRGFQLAAFPGDIPEHLLTKLRNAWRTTWFFAVNARYPVLQVSHVVRYQDAVLVVFVAAVGNDIIAVLGVPPCLI